MATRADFQRLRELWGNRSGATQEQWHELYTLVEAVLRRARILDGLDREDMVQGYFCDRVLCGRGSSVPDHEAALLAWFQRYQLDQLPRERRGDLSWVEGCEGLAQPFNLGLLGLHHPLVRKRLLRVRCQL